MKYLFCVSKHSWSLARAPYLFRAGEASKLFVTWRPFLFIVLTTSGSHLGRAATVWWGTYYDYADTILSVRHA
jgi:hypothetical protein